MILKPSGGAYLSQTYENLLARAEETSINFAFDHTVSGEDKYVQDLLETDKTCDLSQYTAQQVKAYFSLLIIGSKVSSYKGLNVGSRSRDPLDQSRVDVMREKAMLESKKFNNTRGMLIGLFSMP
jgi:hypothetical protein